MVKNPSASAGGMGLIPGWGKSPAEGTGHLLIVLAWRTPWTEEPGRLQSMGSQKSQCLSNYTATAKLVTGATVED